MMVWQKKGRDVYQAWVYPVVGDRVAVSTGTTDRATAESMAQWADDIASRGDRLGIVSAIASRAMKLGEAYHYGEHEAVRILAERRAQANADATAAAEAAAIIDVWPFLEAFAKQRAAGKKPIKTAHTALQMARHVFPEDPCPHMLWEDVDLIEYRLTTLVGKTWKGKRRPITSATRNRYKSALSVQAEQLRRLKIIRRNVLADVASFPESPLDYTYLELPDAKALIEALDDEGKVCAALALGFGMEWTAIEACEARHIDTSTWTAHPFGTKAHTRDRIVPLSDVFAFLKPILQGALAGKMPRAKLVTTSNFTLLDRQKDAAEAIGVQPITLHQWRHTCAVILLQHGETEATVAHILGHQDTGLVHARYGRHRFKPEHMVTRARPAVTTEKKQQPG